MQLHAGEYMRNDPFTFSVLFSDPAVFLSRLPWSSITGQSDSNKPAARFELNGAIVAGGAIASSSQGALQLHESIVYNANYLLHHGKVRSHARSGSGVRILLFTTVTMLVQPSRALPHERTRSLAW